MSEDEVTRIILKWFADDDPGSIADDWVVREDRNGFDVRELARYLIKAGVIAEPTE